MKQIVMELCRITLLIEDTIMSIATTHKKPAKFTTRTRIPKSIKAGILGGQMLTGQALLVDMQAYHKRVAATPESARAFLTRLGVMTSDGKAKKLIRG
jgi:imidazolonepropionase-like amidohydrolase